MLGLPARFRSADGNILLMDNEFGMMNLNYLELVKFDDNRTFDESFVNVEVENDVLDDYKKLRLALLLFNATTLGKFSYSYIVTNQDYKEDTIYYSLEGAILTFHMIILNKERIYQMLDTLNEKDYAKTAFSQRDLVIF